ncbi:MAG: hypothetical protein QG670_1013 [Thermoproteota archaeon]|nr:hypothetical protein [Thermoproteota archaeon]
MKLIRYIWQLLKKSQDLIELAHKESEELITDAEKKTKEETTILLDEF